MTTAGGAVLLGVLSWGLSESLRKRRDWKAQWLWFQSSMAPLTPSSDDLHSRQKDRSDYHESGFTYAELVEHDVAVAELSMMRRGVTVRLPCDQEGAP